MQIICFEDNRVCNLAPITQSRPAYAVTCASLRLIDRLSLLVKGPLSRRPLSGSQLFGNVRDFLIEIQKLDYQIDPAVKHVDANWKIDDEGIMLVNARLVPRVALDEVLTEVATETRSICMVDDADGSVLIARWTAADLAAKRSLLTSKSDESFTELLVKESERLQRSPNSPSAFHWPHEIVSWHMNEMRDSVEWRVANGNYKELSDGVFVADVDA